MAIPVISPATLEYFSLILGDAPLMISGQQDVTSNTANPVGLRLAGGNLFRDYTPWAEHEINSWVNGIGHAYIGDNGYWGSISPGNTLLDDIRLRRALIADPLSTAIPATKPADVTWTTDPWAEMGIVRANDDNLYAFMGYQIFKYDAGTDTWASWFNVKGTIFPSSSAATTTAATWNDFYIIDMCEFDEFLIIVTEPRFRKTEPGGTGSPFLNEFFIASGNTVGKFISMPNVFAIRTKDAYPSPIGDRVSGFDYFTLPLPHFGAMPGTIGQWQDATQAIQHTLCATQVHQYGGYLFIGGSAGFAYTSGGNDPHGWTLDGASALQGEYLWSSGAPIHLKTPYNVSTFHGGSNWVTGFAGIQGQTVGDFSVYMSTSKSLYMLDLAVPTHVKVMDYSGVNVRNGNGMMAHNNDIYIPVGTGLFRFTQQGQTVPVGIDQVPETPLYRFTVDVYGRAMLGHMSMASTPGTLLSSILLKSPTHYADQAYGVMALKGQGWHNVSGTAGHLHYEPKLNSFFMFEFVLKTEASWDTHLRRQYFADNDADDFALGDGTAGTGNGYSSEAIIHLGFFAADSPLLQKDWQSISIYGRCFSDTDTVDVYFQLMDSPSECEMFLEATDPEAPTSQWALAGRIDSGNDAEFVLPDTNNCSTGRASKWIAILLKLKDTNPTHNATPIVEGLKIKYFAPILDYFRFSFATTLPKDCLTDGCGVLLNEYVQADWDAEIKNAVCSVEPVKFRNVDGTWYEVRVETASRRIEKVNYTATGRTWDVSWSLVLVQVNSATICGPDWEPPVCP